MRQHSTTQSASAVWLIAAVLTQSGLAVAAPDANNVLPRHDPRPTTIDATLPDFPDWFGKGLRPLQAISGEGRVVALLIDFPDRPADAALRTEAFYNDLLFALDRQPTGSFRDFYLEQSYGAYDITGAAYGWFRAFEDYYTTYDDGNHGFGGGGRGVFIAAVLLADPTVDFSLFDSDGPDGIPNSGDDDGLVDACLVYCSGPGGHDTNNPSDIWPHAIHVDPPIETNDPRAGGGFVLVEQYSMQPEINLNAAGDDTLDSFLGVVAHEYGHQLGLPDTYDSPRTWGTGYWDLMGHGSGGAARTGPYHMSAWCKIQLGWITPTVVTTNMVDITIPPVETNPVAYQVWRDGLPGTEYFLLENRQEIGFDTLLPGHGLLIWHIDESLVQSRGFSQTGEAPNAGWFRFALEQADGLNQMATYFVRPNPRAYYPEMGNSGDPYPGDSLNTHFDSYSNPSSLDNNGVKTDVSIFDIVVDGEDIHLSIVIDSTTTPVYFKEFRAIQIDAGVELTWDVSSDEPIDGFRLHRRVAGSDRELSIPPHELIPWGERRYVDSDVHPGESYRYVLAAVRPDGSGLMSYAVDVSLRSVALTLDQNRPNPFNSTTRIAFSLSEEARVDVSIFDPAGKLVRALENKAVSGGTTQVEWDGKDSRGNLCGSGIYFYRLKTGKHTLTRKMVLLR